MKEVDSKTPVDAIYLDLQKAFDTVPHKRLIKKLEGYGICGNLLLWIKDFLDARSQYVCINGVKSSKVGVISGVPQGSVLGPILFLYYINDMPDHVNCDIKIFADDTKIYSISSSEEMCSSLQSSLDSLVEWCENWLLSLNSDKCQVLHIGNNNLNQDYNLNTKTQSTVLKNIICEKDLGVFVDPNLNFYNHIIKTVNKANQIAGMLVRNITFKSKDVMVPLFKSLVRPVLEYANPVWHPYLKKYIKLIEGVQRRFTKKINGAANLTYENRLRWLKLPSLEYRRVRGDLIEVFKILHGFYDINSTNSLFVISDSKLTRGHNFKLIKRRVNTNQYQHFFTNRVINLWNNLTAESVNSKSLNLFKNNIDKIFSPYVYTTDVDFLYE